MTGIILPTFLEKLSALHFGSNQSDLARSVKNSVRISLKKSGYLSLTVRKRHLSDILNFLTMLGKNNTYCPLLCECYVIYMFPSAQI